MQRSGKYEYLKEEDTQRNYNGCYVEYRDKLYYCAAGGLGTVELLEIDQNGRASVEKRLKFNFNRKPEAQGWIKYPKSYFFELGGSLCWMERSSKRQFLFGMTMNNTNWKTFSVVRGELGITSRKPTWLGDAAHVKAWAFPVFSKWSPKSAVTVLSKHYAVCGSFLLRDGVQIGQLQDNRWFKLDEEHDDSLTRQDLRDLEVPI